MCTHTHFQFSVFLRFLWLTGHVLKDQEGQSRLIYPKKTVHYSYRRNKNFPWYKEKKHWYIKKPNFVKDRIHYFRLDRGILIAKRPWIEMQSCNYCTQNTTENTNKNTKNQPDSACKQHNPSIVTLNINSLSSLIKSHKIAEPNTRQKLCIWYL